MDNEGKKVKNHWHRVNGRYMIILIKLRQKCMS